ncbi:hypothetical protein [Sorangium sp. So ce1151]|uniref:hypothetical protein n=1 Tax=Sorangium sp. So ce1151 TaxID=3133332 RepID=UPI003F648999
MSSAFSFEIELLGADDPMGGGLMGVMKMALTARRVSTAWTLPFEMALRWRSFNEQEHIKGEILRRFSWDCYQLLNGRPGWGVLIEAESASGPLLGGARIIGAGPTPEEAMAQNASTYQPPNAAYFWVTGSWN